MAADMTDHLDPTIFNENQNRIREMFSRNCALYFPPNRFEEPAWLNEENLLTQAEYMDLKRLQGHTIRKVINYSPLTMTTKTGYSRSFTTELFLKLRLINVQTYHLEASGQSVSNARTIVGHFRRCHERIYEIALQVVRRV